MIGNRVLEYYLTLIDWPRMINIWDTTFLVGPFMAPALAGYLDIAIDWRGAFAVLTGLYGFSTILVFLLGKETYYVTHKVVPKAPTFIESLFGRGGALAVERPSFTLTATTLVKFVFRVPLLLVGEHIVILVSCLSLC